MQWNQGTLRRLEQAVTDSPVGLASDAETIAGVVADKAVSPAGFVYGLPHIDVRTYGAVGDNGVTDNTVAIQAALTAAAAAGGGIVFLPPGSYWAASLMLDSNVTLVGCGRSSQLVQWPSSTGPLLSNASIDSVNITIRDLQVNGAAVNQTSATNHGISLDHTGSSNVLRLHRVLNVRIQACKGSGLYVGEYGGDSTFDNISIYQCDEYGLHAVNASDSMFKNINVGQSGKDGVYLNGPRALHLNTVKSWFSGRLDGIGCGFRVRGNNVQTSMVNCKAQENKGHGFFFFGTGAGTPLTGLMATSLTSDADNTAASTFVGVRMSDVTASVVRILVGQFSGGAGTPAGGVSLGTGCVGNIIDAAWDSSVSASQFTGGSASRGNSIRWHRGHVAGTYAASYTPDIWTADVISLTLTGAITVNAPAVNVAGQRLTFIFTQNATGGWAVTWNAVYKAVWTPNTAANKINIIEFVCDGANWQQVASTVGI